MTRCFWSEDAGFGRHRANTVFCGGKEQIRGVFEGADGVIYRVDSVGPAKYYAKWLVRMGLIGRG